MNSRQIRESKELYGVERWGSGYFSINELGQVVAHPSGHESHCVPLTEVLKACLREKQGTPLILRFPQMIQQQMARLSASFKEAIWEYSYDGDHFGVFPFKVNQRREFIDHIVKYGYQMRYGLEVGSKTELLAALAYELHPEALFICNGFKDSTAIELAFISACLDKNMLLVVENQQELQTIASMRQRFNHCPKIGIRIKLYSKGSGKWSQSSGDTSKFGLQTTELLRALQFLKDNDLDSQLSMLHFHIGSQVTEIKRFKNAINEASRVYAKVVKLGFKIDFLDIGGGVGVDYDGSKTSFQSSANYSIQEFANDVVYQIGEVCKDEEVACPNIVTEAGRVIAAYHSVLVTNIKAVQGPGIEEGFENLQPVKKDREDPKALSELKYVVKNINRKNYVEFYHDAIEYYEELFTLFNLGYIDLEDRAEAEQLYYSTCQKAIHFSSYEKHPSEEFEKLQQKMVSKFLANFSIFQSIPDAWSIDQLFPVMPLDGLNKKPDTKGKIVDITCDSDGCLDQFIDRRDVKNVLDLHTPSDGTYHIGFFLIGAYQESLSTEHNLFGAIHEAEITVAPDGTWNVDKQTSGDTMIELLACRNYEFETLMEGFKVQLKSNIASGRITEEQGDSYIKFLRETLTTYPYLSD